MITKDQAIFGLQREEENVDNDQIVANLVQAEEKMVNRHYQRALFPGTEEQILRELHKRFINRPCIATGRHHPLRLLHWIWKKAKITRNGTTGGIVWVTYREHIFHTKVHFFFKRSI